ncbi:MAG: ABC transporter ATP-binding protein [Candidatus Sericytochromatia bacterium]|nr:ABC transporter ATP-binding protein [Candidatus Sericytochromatia bacterium]
MNDGRRPASLEVRGLTKRFGPFVAVDGVDFVIQQGETVGLLGANGAGKTTTLHMLLGILSPSEGEIRIFGEDLTLQRERILGRLNFSSTYVQLPQTLSVRENLLVFARLYGIPRPAARVAEVLRDFDLLTQGDQPTRSLSSGQMTRLHLAKALLNRPELLLLDEPTASLDPDTADRVRTHLKALQAREGLTILLTSHNMAEMEQLCDRILYLQGGRIRYEGTPQQLLSELGVSDLEQWFLSVARQGDPC